MLRSIFNISALITSCKFYVHGLPVIKYIADMCEIIISHSVREIRGGGRGQENVRLRSHLLEHIMLYIIYSKKNNRGGCRGTQSI